VPLTGSPVQSSAVADLSNGLSPEEIATARGMQPSTVKTHLRNVFVKTGVNRQVELVALALRLCIAL